MSGPRVFICDGCIGGAVAAERRDAAAVISPALHPGAMEPRDAQTLERMGGYADLYPELAWEQWKAARS